MSLYSVTLKLAPRWVLSFLMDELRGRLSQVGGGLAGVAHLLHDNAGVSGELTENRNLTLTKRGKPRFMLICSTNNMANPSLRSEKGSARGVRKVTTGLTGLWQPSVHSAVAF